MRPLAVLTALAGLFLAACSSAPAPREAPASAAAIEPAPPPVPRAPTRTALDQCGATGLQSLVGRPRSEIPIPLDPDRQRVACVTCPRTLDYRPDRLNFLIDADTGLIREVTCG